MKSPISSLKKGKSAHNEFVHFNSAPRLVIEFTSKAATVQGGSAEIAPTPNVKWWDSVAG
jgi:hypothetical protein